MWIHRIFGCATHNSVICFIYETVNPLKLNNIPLCFSNAKLRHSDTIDLAQIHAQLGLTRFEKLLGVIKQKCKSWTP